MDEAKEAGLVEADLELELGINPWFSGTTDNWPLRLLR